MGFKKGKEKTGGRSKGQLNIVTAEIKEIINSIISDELVLIPELLLKMDPAKRVEMTIKLLQYIIPKISYEKGLENIEPRKIMGITFDDK